MKKYIVLLFIVAMYLSGCGNNVTENTTSVAQETVAEIIEVTPAEDFEYTNSSVNKISIRKYIGNESSIVIPEVIDDVPIMEFDVDFLADTNVTEIRFSKGITKIPCFSANNSLRKITLPSTLESYNGNLRNCAQLEEIIIEESELFKTTDGCLYSKDEKKLIAVPAGLKGEFTVPDEIEIIDFDAFKSSSLTKVTLPDNLTEISDYAFEEAKLTEIVIPSSVKKIGFGAFKNCALKSVTINEGVEFIDSKAFYCESLKELYLPDSLQKCGINLVCDDTSISASFPTDGLKYLTKLNTTFRNESTLQRALRYSREVATNYYYDLVRHGEIFTDLTGDNFPELIFELEHGRDVFYFDEKADKWISTDYQSAYVSPFIFEVPYYVCYDKETGDKILYSDVYDWQGYNGGWGVPAQSPEGYQEKITITKNKITSDIIYGKTVDVSELEIVEMFDFNSLLCGYDYDPNQDFTLISAHFADEFGGEVVEGKPLLWLNNEEITSFPHYIAYYPEDMFLKVNGIDVLRENAPDGVSYKNGILTLDNAIIDCNDHSAICCSGMEELKINLVGDNIIRGEKLYKAFDAEETHVCFIGSGTLDTVMLGAELITISGDVQVFETIKIERPIDVDYLCVDENAVFKSNHIRCEGIRIFGNAKVYARQIEPESISLAEYGYLEVVMDENVANWLMGGRAIDGVLSIKITDNAKLYAENKLHDTIFCYPNNAKVIVSGNGILEINGNSDGIGLSLDESAFGTLTIEEHGTVKIYNAGACVYAQRIDIDGGTLDCSAAEGGGSVYIHTSKSPYSDFELGFFANGEIVTVSHSNWEMKELTAYADLISADGEFLSDFAIVVEEFEK